MSSCFDGGRLANIQLVPKIVQKEALVNSFRLTSAHAYFRPKQNPSNKSTSLKCSSPVDLTPFNYVTKHSMNKSMSECVDRGRLANIQLLQLPHTT